MPESINELLGKINQYILNPIIILMFVVAILVFFWGLVEFIRNAGSEDGREIGKQNMMWGIIGIFIMVAVYGIVRIIMATFGIDAPPNAYIPQLYN